MPHGRVHVLDDHNRVKSHDLKMSSKTVFEMHCRHERPKRRYVIPRSVLLLKIDKNANAFTERIDGDKCTTDTKLQITSSVNENQPEWLSE